MTSDIVLTAALRSNLLSLQNTQNLIDKTQQNLATGRSVNSALDNPQNFFSAQSLSNRANDLGRLLDGIGQSIRAIEEADVGIGALTDLVEQANSIADQAASELNSVNNSATATSDSTELADAGSDLLVGNVTGVADGDTFDIQVGDGTAETFVIEGDTTLNSLVADINDRASANDRNFSASVSNGQLSISSTNGERLTLTDNGGADFLDDIGILDTGAAEQTFLVGNTLEIEVTGSGDIDAQTTLADLAEFTGFDTTSDVLSILVDGAGTTALTNGGAVTGDTTIAELVDNINSNAGSGENLEGLSARFDDATDTIIIEADSSEITDFSLVTADGAAVDIGQGQDITDAGATEFRPSAGSGDDTLTNLQNDYNELRNQIDAIVEDANFRGTNLLNGDDLVTSFNEDGSNSLTTEGVTFTSSGLGIDEADFSSSNTIQQSIDDIESALNTVRQFGSSIANDLAIIQTRQNFTEETINTLRAGADDLTIADQNEEGANLLALQTRQQLGVTSLSLAAQSQQSVLRLF